MNFYGFVYTLSKTQISDRLRRAACSFVREKLQVDYETIQQTMIYGHSLPFDKLIEKIKQLNEK